MTEKQKAHALVSVFDKMWKEKYGRPYKGNRFADQWGFQDMIYDLGYDEAKSVVEYYFKLGKKGHDRRWLLYNYHELYDQMTEIEKERERRKRIMQETRARNEE